jgi:hypothetical protein
VTQAAPHESADRPHAKPVSGEAVGSAGETPTGAEAATADSIDGDAPAKKERVLHTRVPAVLERELKRFAESLRVPVSNLVRTILEDALNVADAATENVEERLKKRVHIDPLADVFAFQAVTLAQGSSCVKCEREMKPGERAHLGLTDGPPRGRRIFVCEACLPK